MYIFLGLCVIGLGIPILILYRQYSENQNMSKRKALTVLTIIQTVATSAVLLELLSTIFVFVFLGKLFEMLKPLQEFTAVIAAMYSFIPLIVIAFGVVTLVFGYKAMNNRIWKINAEYNSSVANGRYTTAGVWYCSACGKQNRQTDKFCPACGKGRMR